MILLWTLIGGTIASFCGDYAVPFSLENVHGQPVLGCARPLCFGWLSDMTPSYENSRFYMINGRPDGFVREINEADNAIESAQTALERPICEGTFLSSCNEENQWAAGIAPQMNISQDILALQCCSHDILRTSTNRGIASVHNGEIVIGEEISDHGVNFFDYIRNVRKIVNNDGSISYDVNIRRLRCPYGGPSLIPPPVNEQPIIQPQQPVYQQVSQTYYYSNVGSGLSSSCCAYYCFSDDTQIRLFSGEIKRMDELKVDDWVETINGTNVVYAPVTFWLHRNPSQEAEFLNIELDDGSTLKITAKHYIYKASCGDEQLPLLHLAINARRRIYHQLFEGYADTPKTIRDIKSEAVFAEKVNIGDCLHVRNNDTSVKLSEVKNVTRIRGRGIYAPMVAGGKLFVNGILASCHNVVETQAVSESFFWHMNKAFKILYQTFGTGIDEMLELPMGIDTLVDIAEIVLPKRGEF